MVSKKKGRKGLALDAALSDPEPGATNSCEHIDVSALSTVLSAEYPLLDQPLVIALLSDYDPGSLTTELPGIRDQLGILEASLVPDPDGPTGTEDLTTSVSSIVLDHDDQDRGASADAGGSKLLGTSSGALSRTTSTSDSGLHGGESASAGTGPTSVTEDEPESPESELDLLQRLFPNLKDGHLKEALSSEPSLPAAIDHLLSVELIKDVESRGAWPDEVMPEEQDGKVSDMIKQDLKNASAPTARSIGGPVAASSSARAGLTLSAPGPSQSASNSSSSRKFRSKRSQITVPLVDTLQRSSPLSSPAPSRGQSPSRGAGSRPPKQLARPSDNAWGTMASLAAHLSDLLPHPAAHFISYLHSPRYFSPYSAVRASLSDLPASPTIEPDVRSQQVLEEMYGIVLGEATLQTQADLELCIRVAGGDVATVMDLMDLMAEISMWGGDDDLEKYDQYSVPTSPVPSAQARLLASPRTTASPSLPTSPLMPPPPGLASHDDDHPPSDRQSAKEKFTARATKTPILANGTTEPFHAELLMRPTSNAQTKVVIPDRIIPGAKAGVSSTANPTAHDNFGATSSFAPLMGRSKSQPGRGRQVHPLNWRQVNHEHERQRRTGQLHPYASHIPSYARGALPHDATPGSLFTSSTSEGGLTVEECLRRAQAERDKRETSVRLAGRHYKASSKAATRGSVAGSYAIRARESADAARQWELKAARMVVMSRLEKTGHTIDLHNLTIMEAKEVVLEAAERWWEREKIRSFAGLADASAQRSKTFVPNRGLTVITGVGRHSAGRTGVLGPAVANALEEHGWRIERGERTRGYITVHGRIA